MTADPRSPIMVELLRSVVVKEGAVSRFATSVVPERVEPVRVEKVVGPR